jgi:hypothetical protein
MDIEICPLYTQQKITWAFRLKAKGLRELERLNFQLLCLCFKLALILCTGNLCILAYLEDSWCQASKLILCNSNPSHPRLLETLMLKRSHQHRNRVWICRDKAFKKEHDVGMLRCLSNMDRDFSHMIHTERGGASTSTSKKQPSKGIVIVNPIARGPTSPPLASRLLT